MKNFTLVINCCSNYHNLLGLLGAIYSCNDQPQNIILVFNPYDPKYDPIFDVYETRQCDIIKFSQHYKSDKIYEIIKRMSETRYITFLQDTYVITNSNFLSELETEHLRVKEIIKKNLLSVDLSTFAHV